MAQITSLDPPSFRAKSGEHFIQLNGKYLGDRVIFNGPAGQFVLEASVAESYYVIGWVPEPIINKGGTYTVTAYGPNGATEPATFTVVTPRTVAFSLVVPELVLEPARSLKGSYVKYEISTIGGGSPSVRCLPDSGSLFPVGLSLVRCEGYNDLGEKDQAEFTVHVEDGPPVVSVPASMEILVDPEKGGAYVRWESSAYDHLDEAKLEPKCSPASGSFFEVGVTEVVCSAIDSLGYEGVGVFNVDVYTEKR